MGLKEKWGWVIFVMMMVVVFGFGVNGCWGCLEKEKAALLNLKAVLKFAKPEYLASWKEDEKSDCCEGWEGVGCGHNKRVQSLSVVGNYYRGSQVHFNASILLPLQDLRALYLPWNGIGRWSESEGSTNLRSSLRKLERLDLGGNCLGSSIIQQLSGFHSLRSLSLNWTCITGHVGLKDIDAISMNLKELDLRYNDMAAFTTEHNETMKLATTLTKLELLDLSENYKLSNKILSTVCALPSLKHLKLSDTGLIGQIQLQDIEAMTNLEDLDMSANNITGLLDCNETMKLATRLTKLKLLDLRWNHNLGNNFLSIGSALPSLKYLRLADTGLTGQIQLHDIEAMENLEELYLSENNITDFVNYNETMKLATRLTKLKLLDLSWNQNLGNNFLSTGSAFASLKYLILANTGLTGQIQLHDIEAMENLEELYLSENNITDFVNYNEMDGLKPIIVGLNMHETMKSATRLTKLKLLDLSWNYNLGNNIVSIVSALPSLKHLKLVGTGLTGQIQLHDKNMTNDIEAMENLEVLDLSDNSITGFVNYNETMQLATRLTKLKLLDLTGNYKLGNIPSIVSALPSLKHLKLANTGLTGQIQLHEIEAMKNLEELDLRSNSITGFVNCNDCGQMQKLQTLYLSLNELRTLPSCWANLSSLQKLDISNNQIMGNIVSSPLIHLHSLESLFIFKNNFHISDSLKEFGNLTKLKYLDARSNQVIVDDSEQDVHSWANTHGLQLEGLALSNCGLITYPALLDRLYNLRYIDLSDNPLKRGEFPKRLLENNPQLEVLFMRNNSLIGELHLPSFPLPHLSVIDISQNVLHGQIPSDIGAVFPRLEELYMSNNEFNGDIPSSLYDMKFLSHLSLSDNQLSGGFGNLPKGHARLSFLALSNNKLEGELPSFYGFPSLDILELQGNNFSGTLRPNLFNPTLLALNLGNNSLQGPIPKDFYGFYRLVLLDLSDNMLNGSVPSCLFNLATFLYLHHNNLRGHITVAFDFEYTNLLEILDLSHNDLSGEIPATIGNFTSLSTLILKGNQFNSSIPIELCKLNELRILDLSDNRLSGPIPSCLSNLVFEGSGGPVGISVGGQIPMVENMRDPYDNIIVEAQADFTTKRMSYVYKGGVLFLMSGIDLSCNKLAGEIPSWIGNLSHLHALNLSHNNLWGSISTTFSNLKNVESLDLSYNHLDGSIPMQLLELDTLEVFTVAYNNLSGKIPNNAHFTTFEASSYEGNALLCGFPLSRNCTASELPSGDSNDLEDKDVGDDDEWMDMETFYVSFAASSITVFLVVLVTQWINPYWTNLLFYLTKLCVLSSYYFIQDTSGGFRRVRN